MLEEQYIKLKYENEFKQHKNEECSCELVQGGKGLCIYGQYLSKIITAKEFLKDIEDEFSDLEYGTFIRTTMDDAARIIGVIKLGEDIFFKLDREVMIDMKDINKKSNMIRYDKIKKHTNKLEELVKIGDIANGKKIIKITDGKLCYGYWGNEHILGEVTELLTRNEYQDKAIFN